MADTHIGERVARLEAQMESHESWLRDLQGIGRATAESLQRLAVHTESIASAQAAAEERCVKHEPIVKQAEHMQWLGRNLWAVACALGFVSAAGSYLLVRLTLQYAGK